MLWRLIVGSVWACSNYYTYCHDANGHSHGACSRHPDSLSIYCNANQHTYTDSYCYADPYPDTYYHADRNANQHSYADSHRHTDCNANQHSYGNADTNTYSNSIPLGEGTASTRSRGQAFPDTW